MNIPSFSWIWLLCASLLMLTACGEESSSTSTDSEAADSVAVAESPEADCFQSADVICEEGLMFARLGGFLADVYLTDLPEGATQDSMENGNGYEWLTRTLNMDQGRLVVEGEFIDERESNDTILSNSRINRLRIETPYFRTSENLRVGSYFSDIKAAHPDLEWYAVPLADYRAIQLRNTESHIGFVLTDTSPDFALSNSTEEIPLDQIPDDAQVAMIVVM